MMKNLNVVLKHAQKMQEDIAKVQEQLEDLRVTGTSGGGMVEVTVNGRQQIIDINIEPEVFESHDKEMLEDLITAAVNQALANAHEEAQEQMSKVTGGILKNLPDGVKIPGLS
jgi:DNA-binding YbaB/EbfC family protein